MVSIQLIDDIITDLIHDNPLLTAKCWSRKRITERLSGMSFDERNSAIDDLHADGIISDWEKEYYNKWARNLEKIKNKDTSRFPKREQDKLAEIQEAIYQIESKIVTKKPNELSNFNEKDYNKVDVFETDDTIPSLEQSNIDLQQKKLDKINFDTYGDGTDFFGTWYENMNKQIIYGDQYWTDFQRNMGVTDQALSELKQKTTTRINHLNYLIDNVGGLGENTVLYRGGKLPVGVGPGGKSKFEAFQSTSYNKEVAEDFQRDGEYMIQIYAPKGTKGLSGNAHYPTGSNMSDLTIGITEEHEFLLKPNQQYIVLERDDKNMTAKILLV